MTLVVFRLEDAAGGTLVTVTESGFDQLFPSRVTRVFGTNEAGWKYQMAALEKYFGAAQKAQWGRIGTAGRGQLVAPAVRRCLPGQSRIFSS
jgi:hypothetical protein